jgi:hypothetical protein
MEHIQQQQLQINQLAHQIQLLEQQLIEAQQNNNNQQPPPVPVPPIANNTINVPAPVVTVNNVSTGNKLKPAKPSTYDGKRKNDVDIWLNEMIRYFKACGIENHITDLSCVPFAVSQLRSDASVWWDSLKQLFREVEESQIEYWPQFEQAIQEQFQTPNKNQDARDQLAKLKQIKSVKAYTAEFIRIAIKIENLDVIEKLDRFIRGLKPNVCFEVRRSKPQTFGEAVNVAEAYDNLMWSTQQLSKNQLTMQGKAKFYTGKSDRDTVPMEICNTELSGGEECEQSEEEDSKYQVNLVQLTDRAKKLNISVNEYRRRLKNKLCLKCAKKGHHIQQCKFNKPQQQAAQESKSKN